MAPYVYWFLFSLGLVALELATGTFYLLVLGVAVAVGGFAALSGLTLPLQFFLSAVTGVVGTVILRRSHRDVSGTPPNQSLDIGQPVQSVMWREDGSARAMYRGAEWDAEAESPSMPREGAFYIKSMRGSTLILSQLPPR